MAKHSIKALCLLFFTSSLLFVVGCGAEESVITENTYTSPTAVVTQPPVISPTPTFDEAYIALRQLAFDAANENNDNTVASVVVDMDVDGGVATLACYCDGSTSLLFSTGGFMLGLGQEYEGIKTATLELITYAEQVQTHLTPTASFEAPPTGHQIVYVVTDSGVFMHDYDMIRVESDELSHLNELYQRVIYLVQAYTSGE